MFTGIIKEIGIVDSFEHGPAGARLVIRHTMTPALDRGESIAVNGVCLTALPLDASRFATDLSPETLQRTTLGDLGSQKRLNLERALAFGDRLGGHLVQGHVDGVGRLLSVIPQHDFATYRWSYPEEFRDLVVSKGSIAVDGISLTIVDPDDKAFSVAIIPETLERTNLPDLAIGEGVNLEFDIMAKYACNLFSRYLETERA